MVNIKFGTDGWRAIIAKEYTVDNVKRVTYATAKWMIERGMKKVILGHDCRFGGKMFAQTTAAMFASEGIEVHLADGFVSTPMISLGVVQMNADMGIVITASHNPPDYNGYKLKSSYGGPTIPKEIAEVESLIPNANIESTYTFDEGVENNLIHYIPLEQMYIDHINAHFDMDMIRSKINLAYDGMFGAGQNVIKRLFPDAHLLHCESNPSFLGQAPEPIDKNLQELSKLIKSRNDISCGLANDGDADRIGMYDENGNFVDSHRMLMILLQYMYVHKKMDGKVVVSASVTNKIKILADHYGLDCQITKIGFKYIAEVMLNEQVIVGGEESGGIAVAGHIPERDGVWSGLLIMEFMALTGKSITDILNDISEIVGEFAYNRDDLHVTEQQKQDIIKKCAAGAITTIDNKKVIETDTTDGYRFYLSDDEWVMIRPSGTEPVLRVYAQAASMTAVRRLLDSVGDLI